MKKYLIIFICLVTGGYTASAKVWRVNNNPGIACDYTDFTQTVINNATARDTIHIEGSVTAYSNQITVDKELYIFGPGYDLSLNVETQHIKEPARIHSITFTAGSEGSILAGVEHMSHNQVNTTGITVAILSWTGPSININESNIKIINCRLYWVNIRNDKNLSNIDIKKCWFYPGMIRTTSTSPVLNLNITNNFMRNDHATSGYTVIDLSSNTKALISNNTFYGGFKITAVNSSIISNNVFYAIVNRVATALSNDASNTYSQNIFNIASLGGMSGGVNGNVQNVLSVTAANDINWFSATGGDRFTDKYFTAKSGTPSPIRDAADTNTKELGIFGGLSPYELSGLTTIPAVYEIVMPNEVSADGFDVTVKVKAH